MESGSIIAPGYMPLHLIRTDFAGFVRCAFAGSLRLFMRLVCSGSGPKSADAALHVNRYQSCKQVK